VACNFEISIIEVTFVSASYFVSSVFIYPPDINTPCVLGTELIILRVNIY
jgi:hypothetical protein